MKRIYEFKGLNKGRKNELVKEYIKCEWWNLFLSYIFIFLSSSKPIFSIKNGAILVFIWFTLANLLSVYAYINQSDYMKSKKRAKKYSRRHKSTQVERGSNFFPQIGCWNSIGMQVLVAIIFYLIAIPLALYLQFKNFDIYKEDYRDLIIGIFADTYIVAFFNIILQLIIDYIYESANDKTTFIKTVCSLKLKDVVGYIGATVILFMAFIHYFNKEFEGLFGDMSRIMGGIYLLFMIFPLIKCLAQISKEKRDKNMANL